MPALATLPDRNLPNVIFTPNPESYRVRDLAVDTTGASASMARAEIITQLAKTFSSLPDALMESYDKGRKMRTGDTVRSAFEDTMRRAQGGSAGASRELADYQADESGKVSFRPSDPLLNQSKIDYYNQRATQPLTKPTLYDVESEALRREGFRGLGNVNGGAAGKITDYGQASDPWKDSNSLKGIGAWDNKLEPGVSVAVSPDVRAKFEAAGIGPMQPVTLRLSNGQTITARWDDVTANDTQAQKLGLPPLRGRYDIYSPSGPHPMRDAQVVGFEKAGVTGDPPLPPAPAEPGSLSTVPMVPFSTSSQAPSLRSADEAPASLAQVPVAVPTVGVAPGGVILRKPTGNPESMEKLMPGETNYTKSEPYVREGELTGKDAEQAAAGMIFPNADAARAAGYDPEGADVLPDGSVRVTKFKPTGTDVRGRSTLTDSAKKALSSPVTLIRDMEDIVDVHEKMFSENKAGPVAGRLQGWISKAGYGDAEYVDAQGLLKIANFRIARLLNGPGVLTDKDIQRAQDVAPTLNETPASFRAKMGRVKKSLASDVEVWLAINGDKATEEQKVLAESALKVLRGESATPEPAKSEAAAPTKGQLTPEAESAIFAQRGAILRELEAKLKAGTLSPEEAAKAREIIDNFK